MNYDFDVNRLLRGERANLDALEFAYEYPLPAGSQFFRKFDRQTYVKARDNAYFDENVSWVSEAGGALSLSDVSVYEYFARDPFNPCGVVNIAVPASRETAEIPSDSKEPAPSGHDRVDLRRYRLPVGSTMSDADLGNLEKVADNVWEVVQTRFDRCYPFAVFCAINDDKAFGYARFSSLAVPLKGEKIKPN